MGSKVLDLLVDVIEGRQAVERSVPRVRTRGCPGPALAAGAALHLPRRSDGQTAARTPTVAM